MLNWIRTLALVATTSFLAACGGGDDPPPSTLSVAQSDSRFSILVEAVNAAGLADTLAGPGPLTVFAPTNDAFAALLTELGVSVGEDKGSLRLCAKHTNRIGTELQWKMFNRVCWQRNCR